MFIGRTDAKAEAPLLWPPDAKSQLTGKDLMLGKIEGRRRRGQKRMRCLDGIANSKDMNLNRFLGVGDGQGSLACCSSWGREELDTTEQLNISMKRTRLQAMVGIGDWWERKLHLEQFH